MHVAMRLGLRSSHAADDHPFQKPISVLSTGEDMNNMPLLDMGSRGADNYLWPNSMGHL